jgi:hypothetical protein
MSTRLFHFVGTLPDELAPTAEDGMRWILKQAGHHGLTALPCDDDRVWIVEKYLKKLAERPAFDVAVPGDYRSYGTMQTYRPATAKRAGLTVEDVSMGRLDVLLANLETFRALRAERPEAASLRFQSSLPSPLDLCLFTFARTPYTPGNRTPRLLQAMTRVPELITALKHLRLFDEAQRREVAALHEAGAQDIVFQFETPAVLVLLDLVPRPLRKMVAKLLAKHVARFFKSLPAEAKVSLHLCFGNLGDQSLFTPTNMDNHVLFLNALARELRRLGLPLPDTHLPVTYGSAAPSTDPRFYAMLRRLDPAYRVIAGLADEGHPEASMEALRLFEEAAGRTAIAVACGCGLGRHSPQEAHAAAQVMAALADTEPVSGGRGGLVSAPPA